MGKPTEIVPAAIVQPAVDLSQVRERLSVLIAEINKGEALIEHGNRILMDRRYQAGVLFSEARKQFPKSGPRAAGWGEFCEAVGVSRDTASRYMEIAAQVAAQPELAERKTFMDLYRELGLNTPPPQERFAAVTAAKPASQIGVTSMAPAVPVEAPKQAPAPTAKPKTQSKPAAPERPKATRIDKRDSQEDYDPEGPPARVDEPAETGAETVDRISAEFRPREDFGPPRLAVEAPSESSRRIEEILRAFDVETASKRVNASIDKEIASWPREHRDALASLYIKAAERARS